MSIRTTVTLEEDVVERVKDESRSRGMSFRETLNDLLRTALLETGKTRYRRTLRITPVAMARKPGLNYDDMEGLISYGEGEDHR